MKTKTWIAPVVLGFIFGLAPAAADEAKKAKIEELLTVMKADKLTDQMFDQMKTMMTSQVRAAATPDTRKTVEELSTKIVQMIQDRMSWSKLKPEYIRIYDETFTDEEISGMLAFYRTPVGQAMLEKMPAVMQKSMEMGRKVMTDLLPEIQRLTTEMREKQPSAPPNK